MLNCKNNVISLTRGDTAVLELTLKNNENFIKGDMVYFTVKYSSLLKEYLIQKVINVDEDTNLLQIVLESNDTNFLDFGDYIYDVELNRSNGIVNTVIKPNKFRVLKEITDNSSNNSELLEVSETNNLEGELNNATINMGISLENVFKSMKGTNNIKTIINDKTLEISGEELKTESISNIELENLINNQF